MTPADLRAILSRLGLTQSAAGLFLGVDTRTIRRWANGERDIPEVVARVMRMADAGKLSLVTLTRYGTETPKITGAVTPEPGSTKTTT